MAKSKSTTEQEPLDLDTLHEAVATIFDQVQSSLANHKKNCVALYKLHQRAAAVTKSTQKKNGAATVKYTGERAFADSFLDMVNRILGMKKGPASVDRIVKFVGSYIQYLNEKGARCASFSEDHHLTLQQSKPKRVKRRRNRNQQLQDSSGGYLAGFYRASTQRTRMSGSDVFISSQS